MKSFALLALTGLTAAHFEVLSPKPIGFDDSKASSAPCGGITPDISEGSDQLVDVHVGGESIALRLTHSRCTWLFRATLDGDAEDDWERLFPTVTQSGLGDFCEPAITFPEDWAGKRGIISIASSANDGILYNCIAANFVSGSSDPADDCKNATSVRAYFESNTDLDALVGDQDDASPSASGTGSAETTASEAEPSATGDSGAMAGVRPWSVAGWGGSVGVTGLFVVLGGALMV